MSPGLPLSRDARMARETHMARMARGLGRFGANVALCALGAVGVPLAHAKPAAKAPAKPAAEAPAPPSGIADALRATVATDPTAAANGAAALLAAPEGPDTAAAWAVLGAALDKLGKPHAAFAAWSEALARTPAAAGPDYVRILDLADAHGDTRHVGGLMGADFAVPMDGPTRARVALAAARHHFSRAAWGDALGLLPLAMADSATALDAEVLRAVTLAQQARYGEALPLLITAREKARAAGRDPHEVHTLTLNIARTFFALGNQGQAAEFYAQVPRDDAWWPTARFETAWAAFRAADMPKVLGELHTHHSPFFADWYFPEAELLRAQALFLMCKFGEATRTIDGFQARYQPLLDGLTALLPALDASAAFEVGAAWLAGEPTRLPVSLIRGLSTDSRFATALQAVADGRAEQASLGSAPWAAPASAALGRALERRVAEEGGRVRARAAAAEAELREMLQDIELTRIDLLTLESQLYSRAAQGEKIELGDPIGRLRKLRKAGRWVWPFQGEYWQDELGYYRVDTRSECPADLALGSR